MTDRFEAHLARKFGSYRSAKPIVESGAEASRRFRTFSLSTSNMPEEIHTYRALRKHLHEVLRRQHPEWIEVDGASPICDSYDARFAELLEIFSPAGERVMA